MIMYYHYSKRDGLIYQENKPSKNKPFIMDKRTLDFSKKGLKAVNHSLSLYINDKHIKDIGMFPVSCGHDMHKLNNKVKNILNPHFDL